MKVIDLLVKMANGEEVPRLIKYNDVQFKFNEIAKDYIEVNGALRHLFTYYLDGLTGNLNDEIEIIEEPKEELKEIEFAKAGDETIIIINKLIENQNKIIKELKANK